MPIRPERKHLYPVNWKTEIVPAIRARSGNKCEVCGVAHGTWIYRSPCRQYFAMAHMSADGLPWWPATVVRRASNCQLIIPGISSLDFGKPIKVVLTTAHLNHDETDNRPENLAHLCQLHHNRHDAQHRAETRKRKQFPEVK